MGSAQGQTPKLGTEGSRVHMQTVQCGVDFYIQPPAQLCVGVQSCSFFSCSWHASVHAVLRANTDTVLYWSLEKHALHAA